jgi:23S rRNA (adenine2503-C2)-methyltransferase
MECKKSIYDLTLEDFSLLLSEKGFPRFRAQQVYNWLYKQKVNDTEKMTNLPADMRSFLLEQFSFYLPEPIATSEAADRTVKFQLKMEDGASVESVLMQASTAEEESRGVSLCISSQVGCALACKFCATGTMGLKRNLTSGEIVSQVVVMLDHLDYEPTTVNIIYMGMGEPFQNTDNVLDSLAILSEAKGLEIPMKRITVSTAGIPEGIYRMFQMENPPRLALSLHAPSQEMREELVPIALSYDLDELMDFCRQLPLRSKEKITIEYVLLDGVNDKPEHAQELAELLSDVRVKVNLIPFNESPVIPYKEPSEEAIDKFMTVLTENDVIATVRRSKGRSASAACGQLVLKNKNKEGS